MPDDWILENEEPVVRGDLVGVEKGLRSEIELIRSCMLKQYDMQERLYRSAAVNDKIASLEDNMRACVLLAEESVKGRRRYVSILQSVIALSVVGLTFVCILLTHIVQSECH